MKNNFGKISVVVVVILVALFVSILISMVGNREENSEVVYQVTGIIIDSNEEETIVKSGDDELYKFDKDEVDEKIGTEVSINYKKDVINNGVDKSNESTSKPSTNPVSSKEDNKVLDYSVVEPSTIPDGWLDGGLFSAHYVTAYEMLKGMSLEEKIGQVFIVRYPSTGAANLLSQYHLGGYVFYEKDFKGKTKSDVINMISFVQSASKIPLLTAIDEEGGIVSRLSSNTNLISSPFKSPQELYSEGGFDAIVADTRTKNSLLKELGLNLNFAPVVDVSENPSDYIYKRTLGLGTELTSTYASTVIGISKGSGVSYTLKHFPGYGSNLDTHIGGSTSKKSYNDILVEDIPPFKAGIAAGAEAVMVSHNIVESIDSANESSISPKIHSLLRNELRFTGVIITDDISMGAMKNVANIGGKALSAGNDLIITSDAVTTFNQIKSSIESGSVNEDILDRAVFRVLAWKHYKELIK